MTRLWKATCWAVLALAAPRATAAVSYVATNWAVSNSLVRVSADGRAESIVNGIEARGLALDAFGNYIVATGTSVLRVTPSGKTISTIASQPTANWIAVTLEPAGDILAVDPQERAVWRISPDGASVVKVATYPEPQYGAEHCGIAVDRTGNYFVFAQRATGAPYLYIITPAGGVTPLPLEGPALPQFINGLVADGSEGVIAAGSAPGVFRIGPTGVVTTFATLPDGYGADALARNPETGDIIVALSKPGPGINNGLQVVYPTGALGATIAAGDPTLGYPTGLVVEGAGTTASLPHFAVLQDWQSLFRVVNTGTKAALVQLRFIGEDGRPLSFPYSAPKISRKTLSDPVLVRTIPAGATLELESEEITGQASKGGWVHLTSDQPGIGAVLVFRWIPYGQEAAVSLETRNAAAFVIPYDNVRNWDTGAGVTNVTCEVANIPVVVRDDDGNVIGNITLSLPPLGHMQFLFAGDRLRMTAGLKGTVEFQAPAKGRISVTGLEFRQSGVFTSLPAIAK